MINIKIMSTDNIPQPNTQVKISNREYKIKANISVGCGTREIFLIKKHEQVRITIPQNPEVDDRVTIKETYGINFYRIKEIVKGMNRTQYKLEQRK